MKNVLNLLSIIMMATLLFIPETACIQKESIKKSPLNIYSYITLKQVLLFCSSTCVIGAYLFIKMINTMFRGIYSPPTSIPDPKGVTDISNALKQRNTQKNQDNNQPQEYENREQIDHSELYATINENRFAHDYRMPYPVRDNHTNSPILKNESFPQEINLIIWQYFLGEKTEPLLYFTEPLLYFHDYISRDSPQYNYSIPSTHSSIAIAKLEDTPNRIIFNKELVYYREGQEDLCRIDMIEESTIKSTVITMPSAQFLHHHCFQTIFDGPNKDNVIAIVRNRKQNKNRAPEATIVCAKIVPEHSENNSTHTRIIPQTHIISTIVNNQTIHTLISHGHKYIYASSTTDINNQTKHEIVMHHTDAEQWGKAPIRTDISCSARKIAYIGIDTYFLITHEGQLWGMWQNKNGTMNFCPQKHNEHRFLDIAVNKKAKTTRGLMPLVALLTDTGHLFICNFLYFNHPTLFLFKTIQAPERVSALFYDDTHIGVLIKETSHTETFFVWQDPMNKILRPI